MKTTYAVSLFSLLLALSVPAGKARADSLDNKGAPSVDAPQDVTNDGTATPPPLDSLIADTAPSQPVSQAEPDDHLITAHASALPKAATPAAPRATMQVLDTLPPADDSEPADMAPAEKAAPAQDAAMETPPSPPAEPAFKTARVAPPPALKPAVPYPLAPEDWGGQVPDDKTVALDVSNPADEREIAMATTAASPGTITDMTPEAATEETAETATTVTTTEQPADATKIVTTTGQPAAAAVVPPAVPAMPVTPVATDDGGQQALPPAPGPAIHHKAPPVQTQEAVLEPQPERQALAANVLDDDEDDLPPARVAPARTTVVHFQHAAAAPSCRTYSRTISQGPYRGYPATGTACLDGNGVWRITEEHLVSARPAPAYVEAAPVPVYQPVYYDEPYYYEPSYIGVGYGYGYGHRHYRRW